MAADRPQIWIIAGPNGAGKSTLAARWVAKRIPIVNPDAIAQALPRVNGQLDERLAGITALKERAARLADRETFAVETTLSGHGPLNLMKAADAAGYKVNLVFVGVDDAALSKSRVADRVSLGGHDVPTEAVVRRFEDALAKLRIGFDIADRIIIFDNSGQRRRLILVHEDGRSRLISRNAPAWARRALPGVSWPPAGGGNAACHAG